MVDIRVDVPDFFGAMQRGIASGRATNEYRRGEENRKLGETLAPAIMGGDVAAYEQLAAKDKPRADSYQSEHVKRLKQLAAAGQYMKDALASKDPLRIQAAWTSGVRPLLGSIVKDKPIPEAWTDDMMPAMEQAMAMVAGVDTSADASSGQREFEAKARAAGLKPGTPEYENAARIALGVNPRAVTGAVKFDTMVDADGKPRPQRNRPDGSVEVFYAENNQWVPLGEAQAATAVLPESAIAGEGDAKTAVTLDGVAPERQQKIAQTLALMKQAGFSEQDMSDFVQAQMSQPQTVGAPPAGNSLQTSQPVVGTLGVGRTKEAEEAAKKSATESMRTLSADEVAANGLPPGTFAQQNTLTGEIKVGPAAAQKAPGGMTAKQAADLKLKAGKAKSALVGTFSDLDRMKAAATKLKARAGIDRITGLQGMLPNIPGGEAANTEADLEALKSQIGFAVLQKMRQNSPTGGALGNVFDKEGARLEANLAALDKSQSPEQMRQRLQDVIDYVDSSKEALNSAYEEQFADAVEGTSPGLQAADDISDLLNKYGQP